MNRLYTEGKIIINNLIRIFFVNAYPKGNSKADANIRFTTLLSYIFSAIFFYNSANILYSAYINPVLSINSMEEINGVLVDVKTYKRSIQDHVIVQSENGELLTLRGYFTNVKPNLNHYAGKSLKFHTQTMKGLFDKEYLWCWQISEANNILLNYTDEYFVFLKNQQKTKLKIGYILIFLGIVLLVRIWWKFRN